MLVDLAMGYYDKHPTMVGDNFCESLIFKIVDQG